MYILAKFGLNLLSKISGNPVIDFTITEIKRESKSVRLTLSQTLKADVNVFIDMPSYFNQKLCLMDRILIHESNEPRNQSIINEDAIVAVKRNKSYPFDNLRCFIVVDPILTLGRTVDGDPGSIACPMLASKYKLVSLSALTLNIGLNVGVYLVSPSVDIPGFYDCYELRYRNYNTPN